MSLQENAASGLLYGSGTVPKSDRRIASHELIWAGLELRLGRGRVIATVEPDSKWPGMYRVHCCGKLSDMVNLTRAKDAARSIALMELNA